MLPIIDVLLAHEDAAIRWRTRVAVLGEDPASAKMRALREDVRSSPTVQGLLSERGEDGRIAQHPYQKWSGAHWVLPALADLGYPPGDESLRHLADQELGWLCDERHVAHVRELDGRWRRCASQEGNGVYAAVTLGLADSRVDEIVQRMLTWQWPDGGWNCDKRPQAHNSSFHETLIPMRALYAYARATGHRAAADAAGRAAELFLARHLFRRQRDGAVMHNSFLRLVYPPYWHYDVLSALKVMAETGHISDPRCGDALDWLESRRLPDGGFPCDHRYYYVGDRFYPSGRYASGRSVVNWGGTSKLRANPWVTIEALHVLRAGGRLGPA